MSGQGFKTRPKDLLTRPVSAKTPTNEDVWLIQPAASVAAAHQSMVSWAHANWRCPAKAAKLTNKRAALAPQLAGRAISLAFFRSASRVCDPPHRAPSKTATWVVFECSASFYKASSKVAQLVNMF